MDEKPFVQFAHSVHGQEIYNLSYHLGIPLSETQGELVPIQKHILLESSSYWSEKENEQAQKEGEKRSNTF